jgi:hypothetical protein
MSLAGFPSGGQPPLFAYPDGYNATSTTSLAVGTGSKTLTVQPNKAYAIGNNIKVLKDVNNWMFGDVTAYNSLTGVLTFNCVTIAGSGTYTSWNITMSGPQGIQGNPGVNAPGLGGTTTTGDIVISASVSAIFATPPNPGYFATLPDATTLSGKGTAAISIYNDGDFDYGIRDSTGKKLGWVRAHTGAVLGCADNSTAGGIWTMYGVEKTGLTASLYHSTFNNNSSVRFQRLTYDATRDVILYANPSGGDLYGMVYDKTTKLIGNPTLIIAATNCWAACKTSVAGQLALFAATNPTACYARILTISSGVVASIGAASWTATTTQSNAVAISNSSGGSGNATASGTISVAAITQVGTSNQFVVAFSDTSPQTFTYAFTTSNGGTTLTVGSEKFINNSSSSYYKRLYSIDNTTVVLAYMYSGSAFFVPIRLAGNVQTLGGTIANMNVGGSYESYCKFYDILSDGRIPCHSYQGASGNFFALINVNSGALTTTTYQSSSTTMADVGSLPTVSDYIAMSGTSTFATFSASTSNSGGGSVAICTTSGTTLTTNSVLVLPTFVPQWQTSAGAILSYSATTNKLRVVFRGALYVIDTTNINAPFIVDVTMPAVTSTSGYTTILSPSGMSPYGERDFRFLWAPDNKNVIGINAGNTGAGYPWTAWYGTNRIKLITPIGNMLDQYSGVTGDPGAGESWAMSKYVLQKFESAA